MPTEPCISKVPIYPSSCENLPHVGHSHKALTVGTIDLGTNLSEPSSECGLGNWENPSEPTTPLPSPQYGKLQSSKIRDTFCWLKFPYLVAPDEKSEHLRQSYLVAPDEKSEKWSQQKVLLISLASAFPYCGLGRGVVVSEGFSWFPSPHSLVGSDGFVPTSIVPTASTPANGALYIKNPYTSKNPYISIELLSPKRALNMHQKTPIYLQKEPHISVERTQHIRKKSPIVKKASYICQKSPTYLQNELCKSTERALHIRRAAISQKSPKHLPKEP